MRDDLYSNTSESSRRGGGWVYMNGELYHFGRKGQKWYQTIFGGYDNPKSMTYDPNYGKVASATSNNFYGKLGAVGKNSDFASKKKWNLTTKAGRRNAVNYAKGFLGNAANNFNKYYIEGTKRDVSDRFKRNVFENQRQRETNSATGTTHLREFENKQIRDATAVNQKAWEDGKMSVFESLNLAIQNAQYSIVRGVNDFLQKKGWAESVDRFLSKFLGDSGYSTRTKMTQNKPGTAKTSKPTKNYLEYHSKPKPSSSSVKGGFQSKKPKPAVFTPEDQRREQLLMRKRK